jgi:hypothetical protein
MICVWIACSRKSAREWRRKFVEHVAASGACSSTVTVLFFFFFFFFSCFHFIDERHLQNRQLRDGSPSRKMWRDWISTKEESRKPCRRASTGTSRPGYCAVSPVSTTLSGDVSRRRPMFDFSQPTISRSRLRPWLPGFVTHRRRGCRGPSRRLPFSRLRFVDSGAARRSSSPTALDAVVRPAEQAVGRQRAHRIEVGN